MRKSDFTFSRILAGYRKLEVDGLIIPCQQPMNILHAVQNKSHAKDSLDYPISFNPSAQVVTSLEIAIADIRTMEKRNL